MAALAMLCRAGAWCALMCSAAQAAGVGCGFVGCPPARAAEIESRAATKPSRDGSSAPGAGDLLAPDYAR